MKMLLQIKYVLLFSCLLWSILTASAQKTVRYDLVVTDTIVNFTGKPRPGIAINGQIPAPTLEFTEGDTALVYVHNRMHHETSIHWHGVFLPNEQDGVPYLTTAPIKPHSTHIYKFPIKQVGTYWYHSHTMLQEQIGMYGALILRKRNEVPLMPEHVLVLSDWRDEKAEHVQRSLHNATDWYMIEKRATQNYAEAIKQGHFLTKLENEWKRMHAMDVSDVAYDKFLINGRTEDVMPNLKPGQQVRLRIVNGGAASYFWLTYSGGKITVVANDGNEVEPVEVDRLIIGVSETYDVVVTLPHEGIAHEFVATAEDRTGYASLWLGSGVKQLAQPLPPLKYFEGMKMMNDMMTVGGNMKDMGMNMSLQQMDMNVVMYPEITGAETTKAEEKTQEIAAPDYAHAHHGSHNTPTDLVTLNYAMLRAPEKTNLPDAPSRTLRFNLTGNMNRFVWTIDHKVVSEVDKILIKQGENIRIIMTNNSMMRHPMHLHGHDFRVLNGQGDFAPMKNVIDIMPMETDTIEFHANAEYGDWFFHCHILYHMMSGMGRIFRYENTPPNPQLPDLEKANKVVFADDRKFYPGAEISLESNGSDGEVWAGNTRWLVQADWHVGLTRANGYEIESNIGRYFDNNQFLRAYVGGDLRSRNTNDDEAGEKNLFRQTDTHNSRLVGVLGINYILPWFIQTDLRVDHTGNLRLQISRDDIPITTRLRLWGRWNSDYEYSAGARYILTKYWAFSSHYDSDMGPGVGVTFVY